jgi:hypothetical protein
MSRTQITALSSELSLEDGKVVQKNNSKPDYKQAQVGTPDYSDLLLDKYISVIEIVNPCTAWSDGRWNKLTMAHGCWGNARFVIFR